MNSSQSATKETKGKCVIFCIGSVHGKNGVQKGQEDVFPATPDLADISGDMDSDFENFNF